MENMTGFLAWLLESTGPTLVVLGLLGFVFREKFKQILARSMSEELEAQRARFARDLESYKVSLIADAERSKALQEVRKSIALKVAERRFSVIAEYVEAIVGLDLDCTFLVTGAPMDEAAFVRRQADVLDRLKKCMGIRTKAVLFLTAEIRREGLEYEDMVRELCLRRRSWESAAAIARDDTAIDAVFAAANDLEAKLRDVLGRYEALEI